MRFQVPQFIEVEDKIFGPFTLKQFIYLAGGLGFGILLYKIFPLFMALILGLPIFALAAAFAFYKPNNTSFLKVVESAFYYFLNNRLYTWKKEDKNIEKNKEELSKGAKSVPAPNLTRSKLKDLACSLDVKESIYPE